MLRRVSIQATRLWRDRSGATVIEYAMIVLLIGLVLLTLQSSIGGSVIGFFNSVAFGL
jgi:Flp pilus assembly pilin Flp